eukprot:TRINITY_DN36298_c0_g1_i1.p1 TRINITY_DN36298_c0_g1~~TRINITY_DN36298_c0_g1_i1.p1  ORF type:complete len:201 (+),score=65.48 TRINITY_DN36298_c0_g1_i1:75-677(+)
MTGNNGHFIAGCLCLATVAMLTAAMADGRSFASYDHDSISGIGIWKDFGGRPWKNHNSLLNLGCDDRADLGKTLVAFTFMPTLLSGLSVISSLKGLQTGQGIYGTASVLLNVVSCVFLIIALASASSIYNEEYCDVEVKDSYDLEYAVPFLVVTLIFSIASAAALVLLGAMQDSSSATAARENEPAAEPMEEGGEGAKAS